MSYKITADSNDVYINNEPLLTTNRIQDTIISDISNSSVFRDRLASQLVGVGPTGPSGATGVTGPTGPSLTVSRNNICQGGLSQNYQTLTFEEDTDIGFNNEIDPNEWYNQNKFQPTVQGYYLIGVYGWFTTGDSSLNQVNIQIRKNNSQVAIFQHENPLNVGLSVGGTKIVYLNGTTDYVNFTAYSSSTTSQSLQSSNGTYFHASLCL